VAKREEKLKADSAQNLILQKDRDSLINKLLEFTRKNDLVQNDSVKQLFQNLQTVSEASTKLNDLPVYQQAAQLEKDGFAAIANNQFDSALAKFSKAEKVSPSFHMSYEISNLLKTQKQNFKDTASQKNIKTQIIKNYSWKAPPELLNKIKKQVN